MKNFSKGQIAYFTYLGKFKSVVLAVEVKSWGKKQATLFNIAKGQMIKEQVTLTEGESKRVYQTYEQAEKYLMSEMKGALSFNLTQCKAQVARDLQHGRTDTPNIRALEQYTTTGLTV